MSARHNELWRRYPGEAEIPIHGIVHFYYEVYEPDEGHTDSYPSQNSRNEEGLEEDEDQGAESSNKNNFPGSEEAVVERMIS